MIIGDKLSEEDKYKIVRESKKKIYRVRFVNKATQKFSFLPGVFIGDSGIFRIILCGLTGNSEQPFQAELEIYPQFFIPLENLLDYAYEDNSLYYFIDPSTYKFNYFTLAKEQFYEYDQICIFYLDNDSGRKKYLWTDIQYTRYDYDWFRNIGSAAVISDFCYQYGGFIVNDDSELTGAELFSKSLNKYGHKVFFTSLSISEISTEIKSIKEYNFQNYFRTWQYYTLNALHGLTTNFEYVQEKLESLENQLLDFPDNPKIWEFLLYYLLRNSKGSLTEETLKYYIDSNPNLTQARKGAFFALDNYNGENKINLKLSLLDDLLIDFPKDLGILNFQSRHFVVNQDFLRAEKILELMRSIDPLAPDTLDTYFFVEVANKKNKEILKDFIGLYIQVLNTCPRTGYNMMLMFFLVEYCIRVSEEVSISWDESLDLLLKYMDRFPEFYSSWAFLNECNLSGENRIAIKNIYMKHSSKIPPGSELYHLVTKLVSHEAIEDGYNEFYYFEKIFRGRWNDKIIDDWITCCILSEDYPRALYLTQYLAESEEEIYRGRSFFLKGIIFHKTEEWVKRDEILQFLTDNYNDQAIHLGSYIQKHSKQEEEITDTNLP